MANTAKKSNAGAKGKYSDKIVNQIVQLLSTGSTVQSICETVGIHVSTYFEWLNTKAEFSEAIKKAKENQEIMIIKLARSKLIDKITGYDYYDEMVTKGGVEQIKRHVPPSDTAIIFAIKNYENKIKEDAHGNKDAETMLREINHMIDDLGINKQP